MMAAPGDNNFDVTFGDFLQNNDISFFEDVNLQADQDPTAMLGVDHAGMNFPQQQQQQNMPAHQGSNDMPAFSGYSNQPQNHNASLLSTPAMLQTNSTNAHTGAFAGYVPYQGQQQQQQFTGASIQSNIFPNMFNLATPQDPNGNSSAHHGGAQLIQNNGIASGFAPSPDFGHASVRGRPGNNAQQPVGQRLSSQNISADPFRNLVQTSNEAQNIGVQMHNSPKPGQTLFQQQPPMGSMAKNPAMASIAPASNFGSTQPSFAVPTATQQSFVQPQHAHAPGIVQQHWSPMCRTPGPALQTLNQHGGMRETSNESLNSWYPVHQTQANGVQNNHMNGIWRSLKPQPQVKGQGSWPPVKNSAHEPHRRVPGDSEQQKQRRSSSNKNDKHQAVPMAAEKNGFAHESAEPEATRQNNDLQRRNVLAALRPGAQRMRKTAKAVTDMQKPASELSAHERTSMYDHGLRTTFTRGVEKGIRATKESLDKEFREHGTLFGLSVIIPEGQVPEDYVPESLTKHMADWYKVDADGDAAHSSFCTMREQEKVCASLYRASPTSTIPKPNLQSARDNVAIRPTRAQKTKDDKSTYTLTGETRDIRYSNPDSVSVEAKSYLCSDGNSRLLSDDQLQAAQSRTCKSKVASAALVTASSQSNETLNENAQVIASNESADHANNNMTMSLPAKRKQSPTDSFNEASSKVRKQNTISGDANVSFARMQPQQQAQTEAVQKQVAKQQEEYEETIHKETSKEETTRQPFLRHGSNSRGSEVQHSLVLPSGLVKEAQAQNTQQTSPDASSPNSTGQAPKRKAQDKADSEASRKKPRMPHTPNSSVVLPAAQPGMQAQRAQDRTRPAPAVVDLEAPIPAAAQDPVDLTQDGDDTDSLFGDVVLEESQPDGEPPAETAQESKPIDPDTERIRWFSHQKRYEGLPTELIRQFMHPTSNSSSSLVREAVQDGNTEDLSPWLEVDMIRARVLKEYDAQNMARLHVNPGDRAPTKEDVKAEKKKRKRERRRAERAGMSMARAGTQVAMDAQSAVPDPASGFEALMATPAETQEYNNEVGRGDDTDLYAEDRQARLAEEKKNAELADMVANLEAAFEASDDEPSELEGHFDTLITDRDAAEEYENTQQRLVDYDSDE